jgi:hypothetical protein
MKTTKTIVILLALVLLIAAHSAEAMDKPKISNTRIASCLVKITTDEAVLPLDEFVVDYLLRSSGVAGKAAREVLETSSDVASELFEIEEVYSTVFPESGGIGGGGYGVGYGGGGYGGGGYGSGIGGMGLPADSTPGAFGYGATTTSGYALGASTTSRSTKKTTPTTTRTSPRPPATRTTRPVTSTTTPAGRPTTPGRAPATTAPSSTRRPAPRPRIPASRPPTRRKPTVTQPQSSTTEQTILFRLNIDIAAEDIKPAAEEFMVALIENLRNALHEAFSQYSAKLNQQLKLADKEATGAEADLMNMQSDLRNISDSRDLSRIVILQDISSLRKRLQTTIMSRAADETFYEATVKQIAEEQVRRKKLVQNDPIIREFESILEVHQKRLENTQKRYKSGEVSMADVEDVREKIIRARIDLAKRKEEISNPPGSLAIDATNEDLATLSTKMDLAQQEIRSFEQQLKEAKEQLKDADTYELLSLKAGIARQSLEETLLWRARLGRNIRSIQPPDVTVIGAE